MAWGDMARISFNIAYHLEGVTLMRIKQVLGLAMLLAFATTLAVGCDSTTVPLQEAPPVKAGPTKELPKDPKKGGGAGSSGNMNRDPGGST